jgi:hypothetical protein
MDEAIAQHREGVIPWSDRVVREMNQSSGFKTVRSAHRYLAKPCDAGALEVVLSQALALRRWADDHA